MVKSQVAFLTEQLLQTQLSSHAILEEVLEKGGDENFNAHDLSVPPGDPSKRKASEAKVKTEKREVDFRDGLFRAGIAGRYEDQPTMASLSSLNKHRRSVRN